MASLAGVMLAKTSDDPPPSPLHITPHDSKFYARLLSKEDDASLSTTPSFSVYDGVAPGSVPFVWESQPGTPKPTAVALAEPLPPINPPPSSYFHPVLRKAKLVSKKRRVKPSSRFTFLDTLFRKLTPRESPSSPVSSSFTSSPFSRLESPRSRRRSSFSSKGDEEEEEDVGDGSTRSILCFRLQRSPRITLFRHSRDNCSSLIAGN
ncbi:hypothetical protein C4D60_Mb05t03800 [Musa balbisiana]|uniref:Uncharacterized protein n=1 Tax=Musa balbisiana TaxID=52838 RepID=A0A4S8JTG7_MUSBA|nr:hypothetical protein C4D60_Mb05t03800 [Musa balbisiana]